LDLQQAQIRPRKPSPKQHKSKSQQSAIMKLTQQKLNTRIPCSGCWRLLSPPSRRRTWQENHPSRAPEKPQAPVSQSTHPQQHNTLHKASASDRYFQFSVENNSEQHEFHFISFNFNSFH